MTCKCHDRVAARSSGEQTIYPNTPCLYCAEKHIGRARALAVENGYSAPNRGYVVGEISSAEDHLSKHPNPRARDLSAALRDFRHRIQSREEDEACTDFSPYLAEIDALIREEMRAKMETERSE